MSKRSRQRREVPGPQWRRYDRALHGQGLVEFMRAFDNEALSDGAWQALLEEGGAAYSEAFGVHISGFEAFIEYVELRDSNE